MLHNIIALHLLPAQFSFTEGFLVVASLVLMELGVMVERLLILAAIHDITCNINSINRIMC